MRETANAQQAWADYASRKVSLDALGAEYRFRAGLGERVPTTNPSTLKAWSTAFHWQDRLEQIAQEQIREIMGSGMALVHERVDREKQIEQLLFDEVMDESKRWLADVKQIGTGERFQRVDVVRFNHRLIEQWRGLHKDLAEETGGRKQTVQHTGVDGGPIQIKPVDYRLAVEPILTEDESA